MSQVFIIEGEISAGKSELVRAFTNGLINKGYNAIPVLEPVDEWVKSGILKQFYNDPQRWGYAFQTFVYITRIQAIRNAVEANLDVQAVFVLERSPITDEIFMELQRGIVSDVEIEMYEQWRRNFIPLLPLDLAQATVLYLKPSLDTCMRRLHLRNRNGEVSDENQTAEKSSGVTFQYQKRLREAHEALLEGLHEDQFPTLVAREPPFKRSSVVIIPPALAELNFRDKGSEQDFVLDEIFKLLNL